MNYQNILIIKMSAIGDIIHAIPAAHALKKGFPNTRVTWIVEKPGYDLLTNNPYIDEIIIFDKPKFKSWRGFIKNAPEFAAFLRVNYFLDSRRHSVFTGDECRVILNRFSRGL